MRRLIFTLFAFTLALAVSAQDKKKETKSGPFKQGGWISVVGGQGGSRNWAAGSERFSFSFAAYLNLYANRTWGKNLWENTANIGYAMVNTSSQGVRKQDDKFDLYTKYGYLISGSNRKKEWRAGLVANFRSQLTESFDYTENKPKVVGRFMAPGYVTIAPGVNLKACEGFNMFFGAAARWVIATNQPYSFQYQGGIKPDGSDERPLAELYGVDPQRKVRFEAGPYMSIQWNKPIMKNVHLMSRLDALSDFADGEPQNVDIYFTNTVGMRVNKWLQVTYNFDVISDNHVKMFGYNKTSAATQLRSMLGVGLMAKF
jgi:hypothetical protein